MTTFTRHTPDRRCLYLRIKEVISPPNFVGVHTICILLGFTGLNLAAVAQD